MFLHLIIAAALLTPGSGVTAATAPAAAMVCSIAAEIHASNAGSRCHAAPAWRPAPTPFVKAVLPDITLSTQLRR